MITRTYNPETHKLVPVEPTWGMKMSASSNYREPRDGHYADRMECAADAYRTMLAAAPEAPEQEEREGAEPAAWRDCEAALQSTYDHLGKVLRIPAVPWPDPGAHGHEVTGRAIHASYCAMRFAVMDAIGALTAARCALAAAAPESAMGQPQRCRREPRGSAEYVCDCKAGECPEAHQPPPAKEAA